MELRDYGRILKFALQYREELACPEKIYRSKLPDQREPEQLEPDYRKKDYPIFMTNSDDAAKPVQPDQINSYQIGKLNRNTLIANDL